MERIALIYDGGILYWTSTIITLAAAAAVCGFLCLYLRTAERPTAGFITVPIAMALSMVFARLLHWYAYAESYPSLWAALTDYTSGGFVLLGVFPGCMAAAELTRRIGLHRDTPEMLDCMSLAGGAAIAVGRLSAFFNNSARGQIVESTFNLPWICTVTNSVSGITEHRFATFLVQAFLTALITAALLTYYRRRNQHYKNGDTALLFLLFYSVVQIVLDSTRYDSIYFHSNGFISIVQVSCAITLLFVIVLLSVRLVKKHRLRLWHLLAWSFIAPLLGVAGYMEYHVQRHGDQALFAYTVMSLCLAAVTAMTIYIYYRGQLPEEK